MTQNVLIPKLIARQGERSDRNFARVLGVSVSRWCEVKAGGSPGMEFLRCVIAAYPDLWLDAAAFLSPDARATPQHDEDASEVTA